MHRTYSIALFLLALTSACNFASFSGRPGVQLNSFPVTMHGTYRYVENNKGVKDTHLLLITPDGAELKDPLLGQFFNSHDSNTSLSHLGDYYYLNIRITDSAESFIIYPFEQFRNNILVYKLMLNKKSMRRMEKAGLKSSGRRQGEYTMANEPFKQYVEKHLKHRDAITFTKITQ